MLTVNRGDEDFLRQLGSLSTKDNMAMPTIDYDYDPIADADTGIPKEWTDEEVRAMLDEDEEKIRALKRGKEIFILMNRLLDQLEAENAEDAGEMTSILREKILRGIGLSDAELESTVFGETCRLLFGKITVKEFLRRMVITSRVVDLDDESEE
jgi:hypothetical protein